MITRRLAEMPLFEGADPGALDLIAKRADEKTVDAGTTLVREGDYAYDMALIDEGEAVVLVHGEEVATLGPGDVFGEVGVVSKSQRMATVRASTEMRLITLTGWDLGRIRSEYPDVARRIEETARKRAQETAPGE